MPSAEKFWNKVAKKYAKSPIKDMPSYEQTMDRTKNHLSEGDNVLEVGCGTGSTALLLADSVSHITGRDISSSMIDIARGKTREAQVVNASFAQSGLVDDSLEKKSFDAVMAFNLLHLLEDLPGAIRGLKGLLKPDGLFISKTVCMGGRSWHLRILVFVMRKVGLAPYVNFLRIQELEDCITKEGFKILETGNYPASPPSRFIVAQKI